MAIRRAQLSELHSNYDNLVKVLANAFPLPPGRTPIVTDYDIYSQSGLAYKALIASCGNPSPDTSTTP